MTIKSWHEVPVDDEGNVHSYPGWRTTMTPVEPFEDTLTFDHFERGRSSALAIFRRSSGATVPVFLTDLDEMIPMMAGGCATELFGYAKRGQNYGVKLARAVA